MYISLFVKIRSNLNDFFLLVLVPMPIEITSFNCTNRKNILVSNAKFIHASIVPKGFLVLSKILILIKLGRLSPPRMFFVAMFGKLIIVFCSRKVNLLFLHLIRSAIPASYLWISGISLLAFTSESNLKLQNTQVIPVMFKNVITNLDSSRASGFDCIPVVVLPNYEPDHPSILLIYLFDIV